MSRHWDVSTGEEYACKRPAEKRYDRRAWGKEIDIMRRISHVGKEPIPPPAELTYLHLSRSTLSSFVSGRKRRSPSWLWNTCHSETWKMSISGHISRPASAW